MDISWTPVHASIVGNEIADSLAKEAATEAKNQPECSRSITIRRLRRPSRDPSCLNGNPDGTIKSMAEHTICLYLKWTPRSFWISPAERASVKFYKYRHDIQNSTTTDINWTNATVISAPRHPNIFSSTVPIIIIAEKLCS